MICVHDQYHSQASNSAFEVVGLVARFQAKK